MVRRETYAIGEQNTLMHHALVPFGIDKPDPFVLRVSEIDFAAGVYSQIIRIHTFGNDGFCTVSRKCHDALPAVLARVQAAIRQQLRDRREQLLKAAYYEVVRNDAKVDNYMADDLLKNLGTK